MPHFFLADPSLISTSGHCWSYLRSLITPVKEAGYRPVVLGNRSIHAELQLLAEATPLFQHWCDDRFGSPAQTEVVHSRAIRAELAKASKWFNIGSDDIVLLNSLRHWPLAGVVDWLESLPEDRRPLVALILHFTAYPDPDGPDESLDFYRRAFERIETSPARDRILLMADSQELIEEYLSINDRLHFALAPIPHAAGPTAPQAKSDDIVRLGYIGEARENKGFHLLPYLVHRVLDSAGCENVEFHLHAYTPDPAGAFYQKIVSRLNRPRVTLYREIFDDQQYEQFVAQLDVVILPYTRANYHAQTSGVFAEALAQKKAVVCPRGTWMARQALEYSAGAVFVPDDVEDLARQTLSVKSDLVAIQAAGEERARRWRATHNPQRLLAMILDGLEAMTRRARRPTLFTDAVSARRASLDCEFEPEALDAQHEAAASAAVKLVPLFPA